MIIIANWKREEYDEIVIKYIGISLLANAIISYYYIIWIIFDNTLDNTTLRDRAQIVDWKFYIKWEYTSRNTPQQTIQLCCTCSLEYMSYLILTGTFASIIARASN